MIRAVPEPTVPPRGVREKDLELEQFSKEDSERARDASISERGPDAVDPAFLAALMAEAEADAEEDASLRTRLEDENENQNENENASELKKEHDDAEDGAEVGEPRARGGLCRVLREPPRVVLENENENENETRVADDDAKTSRHVRGTRTCRTRTSVAARLPRRRRGGVFGLERADDGVAQSRLRESLSRSRISRPPRARRAE